MQKKKITSKTKIVVISGYSNVLGDVIPLKEIIDLAKVVNAYTIVDAAQLIAHKEVDVRELDCDFLAFSGHKVCGPTGIGVLYGKEEFLDRLEPVIFGGEMIKEVTKNKATWNDVPHKFEAGTPNIAGAIGFGKAIEYLQTINYDRRCEYIESLAKYAKEKLNELDYVTLISSKGSIILFTIKNVHSHDVAEILNRDNICIRAGQHCTEPLHTTLKIKATNRVSLYFYNTPEDIDALIKSLKKVLGVFNNG